MMTNNDYWEIAPPKTLENYIDACWFYQPDFAGPKWDILVPEGVVDVIFNFGAPYYRRCLARSERSNEWVSDSVFAGQRTKLFYIRWPKVTRIFGIRLKAESAYCFIPGSMRNTANRTLPLIDSNLRGLAGIRQSYHFGECQEIANCCFNFIDEKIRTMPEPDARLEYAIQKIRLSHGDIELKTLSEEVGISRRTLERMFEKNVGITPKYFARAIRLHYFLYLHRTRSSDAFIQSVYGARFYDQSHFIREFKTFTGESPATFFASPPEIYEPLVTSLMAKFNNT